MRSGGFGHLLVRIIIIGWMLAVLTVYLSHRVFGGQLFGQLRELWPR
jgi:hypothetical protein